ncbi:MAG TPA: hypothetical protein VHN11_11775 [Xanthobacteraceae bacterium]|jgi:hypothetical protein|nr:hypothetical protein [Xanthobacteraceae bacterium]
MDKLQRFSYGISTILKRSSFKNAFLPSDKFPASGDIFSRPQRLGDFSAPQIAVLFALVALVASIPVITHPLPPLTDYVNHLARMHVIATIGNDANLERFYEISWQIIPNLMMDIVVPALSRMMSIYQAGQLFTVFTFVLIASGTLVLNRALFGYWSILPLIAFPLLYNHVFLIGVVNYVFGIGLALWGMALWVVLREKPWPFRLIISALFALTLFFCHLFAVGLYGMGLLAFELRRLWITRDQPLGPRLASFVATGLPFVPLIYLLLNSPTWDLAGKNFWEQQGKIDGLTFVIAVYSDIVAFALTAIVAGAAVWAVRHRLLRLHPVGWFLLTIGLAVYLAMPRVLFDSYLADQRLPVALAFMMIACVHLQLRHRMVRRGFLVLLAVTLVVRVIEVDVNWAELSRQTLEFRDSAKRIRRGATVLVAYADQTAGDDVKDLGLVHAACLAMIERSALVTTAFTVPGKQIMHVRRAYIDQVDTEDGTPPSVEQLLVAAARQKDETPGYWQQWNSRFDYLYILFTDPDSANPAPDLLTLVHDGERFQLYRINRSKTAQEPSSLPLPLTRLKTETR